jgi:hypothetical protein
MEVTELIDLIMWDRRYISIPSYIDVPESVGECIMLGLPTVSDKNSYSYVKRAFVKEALDNGVPSEEELLKSSAWSDDDQMILDKSEEHIEYLKEEAEKSKRFVSVKKRIVEEIRKTEVDLENISRRYNSIVINSAEYYANEIAIMELLRRVALSDSGELLWPTIREIEDVRKEYAELINYLSIDMMKEGVLPTCDIRKVARSGEWRVLWSSSRENLMGLFNRSVADLGLNQKLLIYWSKVYDTIYEDPNKPEEDVIIDDIECDNWLENRSLERAEDKDSASRKDSNVTHASDHHERLQLLDGHYDEVCTCGADKIKYKGLGERPQHDSGCNFGVWHVNTQEEKDKLAAKIYGRNNPRTRQLINAEHDVVERRGHIEEQHLRGRVNRTLLGAQSKTVEKR